MMKSKKHTNSCLVRLLGFLAGSGFILLCVTFGLYFFTEKPSVYEQDPYTVKAFKDVEEVRHTKEDGRNYANKEENDAINESIEAAVISPTVLKEEEKQEEKIEVVKSDNMGAGDQATQVNDESQLESSSEKEEEPLEFEEVTVYDSYVLQLDEEVLDQIEHTLENGQIDYAAVISEMFSSLSFSQQVKLLNMILSKVQNVNINEIWNMIRDGISKEDSIRLQQLVQEHFTLEELDELYSYYASIETVENE